MMKMRSSLQMSRPQNPPGQPPGQAPLAFGQPNPSPFSFGTTAMAPRFGPFATTMPPPA